jgi:hypothetical protein
MPAEIRLDRNIIEHELLVLATDPTPSAVVYDAETCQSISIYMVYNTAVVGEAATMTISEGDLADGADTIPSTVVPFEYTQADVGADEHVHVFEFKPSKRFFMLNFAGQTGTDTVHFVIVKDLCMSTAVGSNKRLIPAGLKVEAVDCMVPSGCP